MRCDGAVLQGDVLRGPGGEFYLVVSAQHEDGAVWAEPLVPSAHLVRLGWTALCETQRYEQAPPLPEPDEGWEELRREEEEDGE